VGAEASVAAAEQDMDDVLVVGEHHVELAIGIDVSDRDPRVVRGTEREKRVIDAVPEGPVAVPEEYRRESRDGVSRDEVQFAVTIEVAGGQRDRLAVGTASDRRGEGSITLSGQDAHGMVAVAYSEVEGTVSVEVSDDGDDSRGSRVAGLRLERSIAV